MSLCASCGLQLSGDNALCLHHHAVYGDDWATSNRIMCDFFHRKKTLPATPGDFVFWPEPTRRPRRRQRQGRA